MTEAQIREAKSLADRLAFGWLMLDDLNAAVTTIRALAESRKPLTDEQIESIRVSQEFDQWAISESAFKYAARAIEAAHGITGDKT